MKKLTLAFQLTIVFFLIAAFAFVWKFIDRPNTYVNTDRTDVIKEIQKLNKLETAQFTIEKIIDAGTNGNKFQQILFGDKILLIAHGQVIAGIDLSQISEQNISIEDKNINLTLPAPEIFVTKLDEQQTSVYDRSKGLLTKGNQNLETEARQAAEVSIREAACEGGILDKAKKNAQDQLKTLLEALGFVNVEIVIPEGSC